MAGNAAAANQLKFYADEGVFYLQVLGNTVEQRKSVEQAAGQSGQPDIVFANGPITCTLGYPFPVRGGEGIQNPQTVSDRYDQIKTTAKRKEMATGS